MRATDASGRSRAAQQAGRAYRYLRYGGRVAIILPERKEASTAEQLGRCGDTSAGDLEAITMQGAPDHLSMIRPPYVNVLAGHFRDLMKASGDVATSPQLPETP